MAEPGCRALRGFLNPFYEGVLTIFGIIDPRLETVIRKRLFEVDPISWTGLVRS